MTFPRRIFVSCAHEDESLRTTFDKHLSPLERSGRAVIWHGGKVLPGDDSIRAVESQLATADVVLVLVTADFLASETLHEKQLQPALARRERDGARVIPVLAKPCAWTSSALAKLEPLPKNRIPITLWPHTDAGWTEVVNDITTVIEDLPSCSYSRVERVDRPGQLGRSPPATTTPTRLFRLTRHSQLEGVWLDVETSSTYCVRVMDERIRCCYCFMGDDRLVGEFYHLNFVGNRVFAQFRWMDDRVRGYATLRFDSVDEAIGGWWFSDSVPHETRADLSRLEESLPGMHPSRWIRRKYASMPPWAEAFFSERQWTR